MPSVGDFAMTGALGVDYLSRVENWPLPLSILATLAAVAAFGYCYDRVVLSLAQDRLRRREGIVVTFFFTFVLSFFIEGIAQILFGTNVHAAPALWPGNSLRLGGGLNIERAGILVLACAVISGGMFALYIRYPLSGKAIEASGEGWDAGLEVQWAIKSAGTTNETAVMHKLQHLDINTLGIGAGRHAVVPSCPPGGLCAGLCAGQARLAGSVFAPQRTTATRSPSAGR
ncbi:MAG TPA: hypothetical protein VMC03_13630 [Streptosporangiaceae bacterium]|nr:hypothetical protein [Streptosporangiaceae bacterium]